MEIQQIKDNQGESGLWENYFLWPGFRCDLMFVQKLFFLFVSSHHGVCFTTGASASAPQRQWRQRHTCGRSFYSPSTPGANQRKRRQPKEPKPKIKNIHVNEFSLNLLNSLLMHLFFLVWFVHRWRALVFWDHPHSQFPLVVFVPIRWQTFLCVFFPDFETQT